CLRCRSELPNMTHRHFCLLVAPAAMLYPLSLHDALPIAPTPASEARQGRSGGAEPERGAASSAAALGFPRMPGPAHTPVNPAERSEEHTSELQSRENLVCRLLLEKKNTENPHRSPCLLHV